MMHIIGWMLIVALYLAAVIALGAFAAHAEDLPLSARRARRRAREARRIESIECATAYGRELGISEMCAAYERAHGLDKAA